MKNYTLNIGLENNPFYSSQIIDMLKVCFGPFAELKSRINIGEWDGKPERTLIVNFNTDKENRLISLILDLCKVFTQDAIALQDANGFGVLIYNENFTGEKYNFNPEYFINF